MAKFYMKQKVFSLRQNFDIYNENEEPVFHVESEFFNFPRRSQIFSTETNELLAEISRKLFSLMPQMNVIIGGSEVAQIRQKLSFLKPKYEISSLGWTISGDILSHNYTIHDHQGELIASISRKFFSWSDTFEFDIKDSTLYNQILTISVILAIDNVMDMQENS